MCAPTGYSGSASPAAWELTLLTKYGIAQPMAPEGSPEEDPRVRSRREANAILARARSTVQSI